jgi:hypothetical protein
VSLGETYDRNMRATSVHSRTIYAELEKISWSIEFNHPRFMNKTKRNRSLGSVQALIVELALVDPAFLKRLKQFMVHGGKEWVPRIAEQDLYFEANDSIEYDERRGFNVRKRNGKAIPVNTNLYGL